MAASQASITTFFFKKPKRGRPPKAKKAKAKAPPQKPTPTPRAKMVRTSKTNKDWTKGEGLERLKMMISDWDLQEGSLLASLGPGKVSLNRYCQACEEEWGIKWTTLKAYLHGDHSKRRVPGGQRGRNPVIPRATSNLITQVVQKADRQNNGMRWRCSTATTGTSGSPGA